MVLLTPDFSFLKENPDDEVTDFLDFFLTNENRERDVKKCQIMYYKGSSIPYRLFIYPMVQSRMLHLAF